MTDTSRGALGAQAAAAGLSLRTELRLAGLGVAVYHKDPWVRILGRDYLSPTPLSDTEADIAVAVDPALVLAQRAELAESVSYGYAESLCAYRAIAAELPHFDAFVFHGAVVYVGETAYAFSGKSGVGKSTHTGLWERYFGARYLNGDKPILRLVDGRVYAFGTPWAGKCQGQQENRGLPLGAVCFLSQAKENRIRSLRPEEAASLLMPQTIPQRDPQTALEQMALLDELARRVPLYHLACDVSRDAAELSFTTLTNARKEEKR